MPLQSGLPTHPLQDCWASDFFDNGGCHTQGGRWGGRRQGAHLGRRPAQGRGLGRERKGLRPEPFRNRKWDLEAKEETKAFGLSSWEGGGIFDLKEEGGKKPVLCGLVLQWAGALSGPRNQTAHRYSSLLRALSGRFTVLISFSLPGSPRR